MQLAANSVQLISGGNVIKQGDETPFTFQLNGENGEKVDLTGSAVSVRLANAKVLLLTKEATINEDETVTFHIGSDDLVGHGDMRVEFSVTHEDGSNEIFPAQGYQEVKIVKSLSSLDGGEVPTITIEEFERRVNEAIDNVGAVSDDVIQAESSRVIAEDERQSNEQARINAESTREQQESERQANTSTAITNVENSTNNANTSASNADDKANLAQAKVDELSGLNTEINTAIDNAESATTNANTSASNADTATSNANQAGQYAQSQGDYAKAQGQLIDDILDQGSVASINGKTGNVTLDASDVGAETPQGSQSKADTAEQNAKEYTDEEIGKIPEPTWDNITNKPTVYPPSEHTHSYNSLTDKPTIPDVSGLATQQSLDAHKAEKATVSELGHVKVDGDTIIITPDGTISSESGFSQDTDSVRIGLNSEVLGNYSSAIGLHAKATGSYTTAIGSSTTASSSYTTAIGYNASASGISAIAIGRSASAGNSSTAVGYNANSTGSFSASIGYNSSATNTSANALGVESSAEGHSSTAVGRNAEALNTYEGVLGVPSSSNAGTKLWIVPGTFTVNGTKNFEIPHPKPSKEATHVIRHGAVESPTAGDTLYRYKVQATQENDIQLIDLPDYFIHLNKDVQIFVTPQGHFGNGFGVLDEENERLEIKCQYAGEYNVLVIGTRNDDHASVQDWDIKGVEREIGESWTGETYVFSDEEIIAEEEFIEEEIA